MMDEEDGVVHRRNGKNRMTKKRSDQRLLMHGESIDELE